MVIVLVHSALHPEQNDSGGRGWGGEGGGVGAVSPPPPLGQSSAISEYKTIITPTLA